MTTNKNTIRKPSLKHRCPTCDKQWSSQRQKIMCMNRHVVRMG